jgi:hypothetical protein
MSFISTTIYSLHWKQQSVMVGGLLPPPLITNPREYWSIGVTKWWGNNISGYLGLFKMN